MKKCPYCAEEIQNEATKCRHCKNDLSNNSTAGAILNPGLKDFEIFMRQYGSNWTLINKTKTILSYQRIVSAKKGSCLLALILMFIFLIPGILYLYFANKPARTCQLTVSIDEGGTMSAAGDDEGIRLYNKFVEEKTV